MEKHTSYKGQKKQAVPSQADTDSLKIEVIEKIVGTEEKDILLQLADYLNELNGRKEDDSPTVVNKVCSPVSHYYSTDIKSIQLGMIETVMTLSYKCLAEFIQYYHRVTKTDSALSAVDEALEDIREGRLYQAKDVDDMFDQILKE